MPPRALDGAQTWRRREGAPIGRADHPIQRISPALLAACIGLLLAATPAKADTPLPPTITSDMTWTAAGSPYIGSGTITIAPGATVTVEPGAVAKFNFSLLVDGGLVIQGTESNPAVFTSTLDSAPRQWGGVEYRAGSSGSVSGAEFRYGGNGRSMLVTNVSTPITDSTFKSSYAAGVEVNAGSPSISGSTFQDNRRGIQVDGAGTPTITGKTIERSIEHGIIYYNGSQFIGGPIHVQGNTVSQSGQYGFYMLAAASYGFAGGDVSGNTFTGNLGKALYLVDTGGPDTGAPIPQGTNQNIAVGNGCDCVALSDVAVVEPMTWQPGLPFVLARSLTVAADLTIADDVIVKGTAEHVSRIRAIAGTLDVRKADFTSFRDDTVGGDTNRDGSATQPAPYDWSGITVQSGEDRGRSFLLRQCNRLLW